MYDAATWALVAEYNGAGSPTPPPSPFIPQSRRCNSSPSPWTIGAVLNDRLTPLTAGSLGATFANAALMLMRIV